MTQHHASATQMMAELFGGLSESSPNQPLGPEKRLELDLRRPGTLPKDAVTHVAALCDLRVLRVEGEEGSSRHAAICDGGIAVSMEGRIVITCDMETQLHRAVKPLVEYLNANQVEVEWASFVRKNTACPWDSRDGSIAVEYNVLKDVFPTGRPFVFGPVDRDHYFYYVYDDLHRGGGCVENDVQVNVKLYNTASLDTICLGKLEIAAEPEGKKKPLDQSVLFEAETYQTLRVKSVATGNVATFETNEEVFTAVKTLAPQITKLRPERFTIIALMDPESNSGKKFRERQSISLEVANFPGYTVLNRTMNTFEHGYAIVKVSYVME